MPLPFPLAFATAAVFAWLIYVLYSRWTVRDLRRDRDSTDPLIRAYATRLAAAAQVANVGYAATAFLGILFGLTAETALGSLTRGPLVVIAIGFPVTAWFVKRRRDIRHRGTS